MPQTDECDFVSTGFLILSLCGADSADVERDLKQTPVLVDAYIK